MSKKQRILKMIQDAFTDKHGRKVISYRMLEAINLHPLHEVGDKYNDVIYVMKIANQLGYRARVGGALHLFPK